RHFSAISAEALTTSLSDRVVRSRHFSAISAEALTTSLSDRMIREKRKFTHFTNPLNFRETLTFNILFPDKDTRHFISLNLLDLCLSQALKRLLQTPQAIVG
ncbi:hypothetical protein, partial [Coleofasciculus sp.]|uniref:hypothetical protein n=1 Tax=Coleofasciculus sp. TaxID=3100458 RepID=UPI003A3165ED